MMDDFDLEKVEENEDEFSVNTEFGQSKGGLVILRAAGLVVVILLAIIGYKAISGGLGSDYAYDGDASMSFSEFEASGDRAPRIPPTLAEMSVTSIPEGANIIVNGIAIGEQTPATISVVENELNSIGFYLTGYESLVLNTEIESEADPLEATLVQIVEPEGWTPPTPPEEPEGGWPEGEEPPPTPTEWSLPMGRIRVETSSPSGPLEGAIVLLNGVQQEGSTPLYVDVPARQEQHITVRFADFRDSIGYVRTIPFESIGSVRFLPIELTADRGEESNMYSSFRVTTVPEQATLFLNNEDQGIRNLLNMPNPGHYTIRVEAPDHESWERAFTGGPGIFETRVLLDRHRTGASRLTIEIEGERLPRSNRPMASGVERTSVYIKRNHFGSAGFSQIGLSGVLEHELEAGEYTMRLARQLDDRRLRVDLELSLEPGIHHTYMYRLDGEEFVVVEEQREEIEEE